MVSVQATADDGESWLRLVRQVEAAGFHTLYVPDHPGEVASPFVALGVAAAVSDRVLLGSYVANAGLWQPLQLANEIATLQRLSGGRAVLGLGAGHTPHEWSVRGERMPDAATRVDRLVDLTDAVVRLLGGEHVTAAGVGFDLNNASLGPVKPTMSVPLVIGGNGQRVLRLAAERADVIAVSGLGRTLRDGHHHTVNWSPDTLERTFSGIRSLVEAAGRRPEIEALVQAVVLSDHPSGAAEEIASGIDGVEPEHLLDCPFLWLGSPDSIARGLAERAKRWQITRSVVRADALPAASKVLEALQSAER